MSNNPAPPQVVLWVKPIPTTREETLKWSVGNAKYEIHIAQLNNILGITMVLEHCSDVRAKVLAVVSDLDQHAISLFQVFPRTLSLMLQTMWHNIQYTVMENPHVAINGPAILFQFNQCLQAFIAMHITSEDRHDLLTQLRTATKPRTLSVQTFYYRLREINNYIIWMPGGEPPLTEDAIKQAFYDAMPGSSWRRRYADTAKSIQNVQMADILYFRTKEIQMNRNQYGDNSRTIARVDTTKNFKRDHKKNHHKFSSNKNNANRHHNFKDKTPSKPFNSQDKKKPRHDPNIGCPIHPGRHQWKVCFDNIRNKYSSFANKGPDKKQSPKKTGQYHTKMTELITETTGQYTTLQIKQEEMTDLVNFQEQTEPKSARNYPKVQSYGSDSSPEIYYGMLQERAGMLTQEQAKASYAGYNPKSKSDSSIETVYGTKT